MRGTALLCLALCAVGVQAQTADATPAHDLREQVVRIPVTVKDLYGRQDSRNIPIAIYRPAGDGPHPLVLLNHGRGSMGLFSGDWAIGKALGNCERRGDRCRLYAVDDDVVWTAP